MGELAAELGETNEEQPSAEAVVARALGLVPDADWVSLSIRGLAESVVTGAGTGEQARRADELQYSLHDRPCLEAASSGGSYRSGDVHADARWPSWGPQVAALGVGSMLSVQLGTEDAPLGSLNLYSHRPGRFDDRDEVDIAVIYGAQVAAALALARRMGGLGGAHSTRQTIGIAQGLLMERYQLDLNTSLDLLRQHSTHLEVTLVELARSIVAAHDQHEARRVVPAGTSLAEAAAVMAAFGHPFVVVADTGAATLSAGDLLDACWGRDPRRVTVGEVGQQGARPVTP